MAENGHYYSYIYDRFEKVWWQLNDHNCFKVDEQQVFDDAYGDPKGYKSACNLFYISKVISDKMDAIKMPIYSKNMAAKYQIPMQIKTDIFDSNNRFAVETQTYIITK